MKQPFTGRALIYDRETAQFLQDRGIELAVHNRPGLARLARKLAKHLYYFGHGKPVTIDDVQNVLIKIGYAPGDLGNAAGGVFDPKEWEVVGTKKSERVSTHGRRILVWRLR